MMSEDATVEFLLEVGVLFFGTAKNKDSDEETIGVFININDVFCYAADSENIKFSEIDDLYKEYMDFNYLGVIRFVMQKRKRKPRDKFIKELKNRLLWREEFDSYPDWNA